MDCSNPAFYFALAPDEPARAEPEEIRQEILWRHAGEGVPGVRSHLADCRACAAIVESFSRVSVALARTDGVTLTVCPSAETLSSLHYGSLAEDSLKRVERHLAACERCREDLLWIERTAVSASVEIPRRRTWIYGAAAAAVLFLAAVPLLQVGGRRPANSTSRFFDLAQVPPPDVADLESALSRPEKSRPLLAAALAAFESGNQSVLEVRAREILSDEPEDPAGLFLLALHAHGRGDHAAAHRYAAMSEGMDPMTHFRCWYALQMALLAGDESRVSLECRHLDADPLFSAKTRRILRAVQRRS